MKPYKLIVILLLACYCHSVAQVMNVRKWRKTEKDSLDNGMYFVEENQYLQALPIFENLLNNHPKEEFLRYTYAKCALYRADKHHDAYTFLTELYQKNKKVPDIQYDVALASLYNYKFDEATEYIDIYLANKRITEIEKKNAEQLIRYIANARVFYNSPTQAKLKNLGPDINSADDEYVPCITADESKLIFTYAGAKSVGGRQNEFMQPDPYGDYFEDIYMSTKSGESFKPAQPIEYLNSNLPDAAISLSNDGNILFVYQDLGDGHGDLYQSNLIGSEYSKPARLKGDINSYSWDGHCSISPDGNFLYFSSERGGGYGGRDIYRARLLADSLWGDVINLGDSVNTAYDDDAPYIHSDGKTLYFSSKGHNSMGGYDVFRSVMNLQDSTFKNFENLGYPINSPADDIYFVIGADNKKAYYSSARKDGFGRSDIYSVEPNFVDLDAAVYLVKGTTKDDGKPVEANIRVEVTTAENHVFRSFKSNAVSGEYLITLPAGANYRLIYSYDTKTPLALEIQAKDLSSYAEKINDIDFTLPPPPDVVVAATPTVSTTAKTPTTSVSASTPTVAVATTTIASTKDVSKLRDKNFPKTGLQEKTLRFVEKYGNIAAPGLEFKIQIAAVKSTPNFDMPNKKQLGEIEKLDLGDGYTRLTAGGSFPTIALAFEHNRKVVKAGQGEGFVIALYKGQRVTYDYLEVIGVFK